MRNLITGSRQWRNKTIIFDRIMCIPRNEIILHGHCPDGADNIADWAARVLGFEPERFPADWKKGKGAGHARNADMLRTLAQDTDRVIAFRSEGKSDGTDGMIKIARKRGIVVEVIREELRPWHARSVMRIFEEE